MATWETILVMFLIAMIVLVVLAIPMILRLRDVLNRLNDTLVIVNHDLPEILENARELTKRANSSTKKIEETIDDIVHLEQMVSKEIKEPIQNVAQSLGTVLQIFNKLFYRRKHR
ncbi:MAG: DUF948 domain-containing protein [Calditrichaceae bacterium]|nr:DUF948 domain-containing protein [Calditrichaceae bacterium]MBN2710749.1 DUF948 domain-containing protein [Calditrichaceae bacterium]RQV95700.1 MAG: DUF948 domain-containing protein [Calditrichota bacterium]